MLADVVAEREKGIDLKIVVVDKNPPIDTPLRDIATEVGEAYPGIDGAGAQSVGRGYVQPDVRPGDAGGRSGRRQGRDPVQSSKNFVSELTTQHFPWTAFTIVLVLGYCWWPSSQPRLLQVRANAQNANGRNRPVADRSYGAQFRID